jgi:hypothetical protein
LAKEHNLGRNRYQYISIIYNHPSSLNDTLLLLLPR